MYIIYLSCPLTQKYLEHAFTIQLLLLISIQVENHTYVPKKQISTTLLCYLSDNSSNWVLFTYTEFPFKRHEIFHFSRLRPQFLSLFEHIDK